MALEILFSTSFLFYTGLSETSYNLSRTIPLTEKKTERQEATPADRCCSSLASLHFNNSVYDRGLTATNLSQTNTNYSLPRPWLIILPSVFLTWNKGPYETPLAILRWLQKPVGLSLCSNNFKSHTSNSRRRPTHFSGYKAQILRGTKKSIEGWVNRWQTSRSTWPDIVSDG